MRILSDASYRNQKQREDSLEQEITQLRESKAKLVRRFRDLEHDYQTLVLRIAMKGFSVETQAEIPAKPATLVLKKLPA